MSPFSSRLSPVSLSLSFPSLTSKKEPLLSLLPLLPFLLRSHGKHERKVREAEPIERGAFDRSEKYRLRSREPELFGGLTASSRSSSTFTRNMPREKGS